MDYNGLPRHVGTPEYGSNAAHSQPVQVSMGNRHLASIDITDSAKMPSADHIGKVIMPIFHLSVTSKRPLERESYRSAESRREVSQLASDGDQTAPSL